MKRVAAVLLFLAFLPIGLLGLMLIQERQMPVVGSCELSPGETLTVACSDECGWLTEWAIRSAAKKRGFAVTVISDLQQVRSPDLSMIDALILPGGADIAPRYYTGHLPRQRQERIQSLDHLVAYSDEGLRRDPFEYDLLQQFFRDDVLSRTPILGICRGMQMLAVSQGIPLTVDMQAELGIDTPRYHLDTITIRQPGSGLYPYLSDKTFPALQLHHQAVDMAYIQQHADTLPPINVSALSHGERVPEIMEWPNRPVIGTQFHPEYSIGAPRVGLFNWLLEKACEKKTDAQRIQKVN